MRLRRVGDCEHLYEWLNSFGELSATALRSFSKSPDFLSGFDLQIRVVGLDELESSMYRRGRRRIRTRRVGIRVGRARRGG